MLDQGIAVWVARMVDEPRVVPVHGGVDHDHVVDREQECVMPAAILRVSRIRLGRRQPLAGIFDQPRPGGDGPGPEPAQPFNCPPAYLETPLRPRPTSLPP